MRMCLDCGDIGELSDDHKTTVPVRVQECPVRGSDKRTKRYRDNVCTDEHHHHGRGDHVVILGDGGAAYAAAHGSHSGEES